MPGITDKAARGLITETFEEFAVFLKRNVGLMNRSVPTVLSIVLGDVLDWENIVKRNDVLDDLFNGLSAESYNYLLRQCHEMAELYELSTRGRLAGARVAVRVLPESAWDLYVTRDIANEPIFTSANQRRPPYQRPILLESNTLIRIAVALPAPHNTSPSFSSMETRDETIRRSKRLEAVGSIMGFLQRFHDRAIDGSFVGDTTLFFRRRTSSARSPVAAWVINFTFGDLMQGGRAELSSFSKEEARNFLEDYRLSNNQREREVYEEVLALFT